MQCCDLSGKTAIITGASKGIGKAIALHLASCGANISLVARNQLELDKVKNKILDSGGQAQTLARTQIAGLGTLGATRQAQTQAELDATRQANLAAAQERFTRLGQLGSGVIGLMGGSPARTSITQTPQASPLASALGIGSTLAGIYGALT